MIRQKQRIEISAKESRAVYESKKERKLREVEAGKYLAKDT